MSNSESVRVRFAPSPTGYLHIGGLRTALFNYLFARHHNGTFVLRIEDTDRSRYVAEAERDIVDSLIWAGIEVDEGPKVDDKNEETDSQSYGPYRQSERKDMYKKYAEQLIEQGQAYYAFDTSEDIEAMRERLKKSGNPSPKYDSITRMSMTNSLTLPSDEVQRRLKEGEPYVIRLKVPRREEIRLQDEVRGYVSFESQGLDDQVLLKSDGMPTYHLANVVDDHFMDITHVIRGEEWLSSTPKHILLYRYLGWEVPNMAHLPLIMSPNGGKLSKRNAEQEGIPINTRDYRLGDYEPEALVNFLAFLGWSPGNDEEIFSIDQLIEHFSLDRVSKGGAVFNYKKLLWYNEHYLREKPGEQLLPRVIKIAEEKGYTIPEDQDFLVAAIELMKERAAGINDFVDQGYFFFQDPQNYDEKALKKWKDDSGELIGTYLEAIKQFEHADWEASRLKDKAKEIINERGVGFGKMMMPLRIAVTGIGYGPDLFCSIELLGKECVVRRIETAIEKLG